MVIQENLMPNCSLAIKPHKLHHGYLQAAQALEVQTYVLSADSTCFIGAIIDEETGDTQLCQSHSMHHTQLPQSRSGHGRRQLQQTLQPHSPKNASNTCRTSSAHSSITNVRLTPPFFQPSVLSCSIKLTTQKPWQTHVINFLIMLLHIPMQTSATLQAT
jgi:hypothetical protein